MKNSLFPRRRKPVVSLQAKAEHEKQVLAYCMQLTSENLHKFADGIEELEAEAEAAAQAIIDAEAAGASSIRIRTMNKDLRILDRALEKRKRMITAFEGIYDLVSTASNDVDILFEEGHYEEIIELIPEKALPYLIRSGDPADIAKLSKLLTDINNKLENQLAVIEEEKRKAFEQRKADEKTTDVLTSTYSHSNEEDDSLVRKYAKSAPKADTADAAAPVADVQPVKVSKKATEAPKKNNS